jgi:hypothetical protein
VKVLAHLILARHVIPTGENVVFTLLTRAVNNVNTVYNVNAQIVNNINAAAPQLGMTCLAKIRCSAPSHTTKIIEFTSIFANPFVFYNLALYIQIHKGHL